MAVRYSEAVVMRLYGCLEYVLHCTSEAKHVCFLGNLCICTIVAALHWMCKYQASLLNHAHILLHLYSAIKKILFVTLTL